MSTTKSSTAEVSRRSRLMVYSVVGVTVLVLAAFATWMVRGGQGPDATDGFRTSVDGPWELDFADTAAKSDLTVVMEPVSIGKPVLDRGTDPDTGEMVTDSGDGVPVTINTFRIVEVVAGTGVRPGDQVVVALNARDSSERTDAARSGLTDKTVLLASMEHVAAGESYLVDGDYYTPTGSDNGVLEVQGDKLVPWDTKLETVLGTPVSDASFSQAVKGLQEEASARDPG